MLEDIGIYWQYSSTHYSLETMEESRYSPFQQALHFLPLVSQPVHMLLQPESSNPHVPKHATLTESQIFISSIDK